LSCRNVETKLIDNFEQLEALAVGLSHFGDVSQYRAEYSTVLAAIFALFTRKGVDPNAALIALFELWYGTSEAHAMTKDVVLPLFALFDHAWTSYDEETRLYVLGMLLDNPHLTEQWFQFPADEMPYVTMISRLVQSLDGDRVGQLATKLVVLLRHFERDDDETGIETMLWCEVVLSMMFAGIEPESEVLRSLYQALLEQNCLFSNYHRALLILVMTRREELPQDIPDVIERAVRNCPACHLFMREMRERECNDVFDTYSAPFSADQINDFVFLYPLQVEKEPGPEETDGAE
jgi:hypothetical protein